MENVSSAEHLGIKWYRVPLSRENLQTLNRRSDWRGLLQTVAHLGLLALTGGLAIYGVGRWPWWVIALVVLVHGAFFQFLLNAFHELCHGSVFRTPWLGALVLRFVSVLSQYHFVVFQESHRRHHRYTLHPPYDSEVVLPIAINFSDLWKSLIFDWKAPCNIFLEQWRYATGRLTWQWHQRLFPQSKPALRRFMQRWAWITLAFHGMIILLSVALALWVHPRWMLLPLLTTFARCFGLGLMWLMNSTQHVGLSDNVPDFRLCARTIRVNRFFGFLYWQMQYHIEHHMYAAVPFYNLPKLNRLIRDHLPEAPNGLIASWRHIAEVLRHQAADPSYRDVPALPAAQQL